MKPGQLLGGPLERGESAVEKAGRPGRIRRRARTTKSHQRGIFVGRTPLQARRRSSDGAGARIGEGALSEGVGARSALAGGPGRPLSLLLPAKDPRGYGAQLLREGTTVARTTKPAKGLPGVETRVRVL